MRTRVVATLRLIALVAIEVAAIALLRGRGGAASPDTIDWAHLGRWLDLTAPEDAVTAVVRLVGLVLATWLLASTVLYLAARTSRVGLLLRGARWATLPFVRKVVDGALAASVLSSAVLSAFPAGAQVPQPAPIVVGLGATTTTAPAHLYGPVAAGDGDGGTSKATSPLPSTLAVRPTTSVPPAPAAAAPPSRASEGELGGLRAQAPTGAGSISHVHTVVAGDNLWTIAEDDLARQSGRKAQDLTLAEVAGHWVRVVAANRDRIASGNPNLIFPGETIVCPPLG